MPRRRISPLFAVFVAFVVLMASNAWLKSIFGYGAIATEIPFLLAGAVLFLAWQFNRRAANQRSDLLGSARFSVHVSACRLATPDDIMRIRADQLLLLRQGEHPLAVEKMRYYD